MTEITSFNFLSSTVEENDFSALSAEVRRTRSDHTYSPNRDFSSPLIIRGTNRVLFQHPSLSEEPSPSREALNRTIASFRQADDQLALTTWENLSQIKIVASTPETLIISTIDSSAPQYFALQTPANGSELPLKRFSSMLSIPYSFSKKNPTRLNSVNFQYYLSILQGEPDKVYPVDVVYNKFSIPVAIAQEDGSVLNVEAFPIINLLKANPKEPTQDITQRIPLFGSILSNIVRTIEESGFNISPILQSHSVGYNGNRGRHFVRILLDRPNFEISYKGEPFKLGVTIETDFSGDFSDFGQILLNFSLFRLVCSNGLVMAWTDRDDITKKFVTREMSRQGYDSIDARGSSEAYDAALNLAYSRANMLFDSNGIKIPVQQANLGFEAQLIHTVLDFFIESSQHISKYLEDLDQPFGKVDPEEFISTSLELQKSLRIRSPEMMKLFLLEYTAGEVAGDQIFKTPLDCLNYLTYISRSYDTSIMSDMETKALPFVQNLKSMLVDNRRESVSLYRQYENQISPKLLMA